MYLRALTGYEKARGPNHTSTLNTVNNLGLLYADQGKMNEAEEMYLRALTGYEKARGPDHTSTLNIVKKSRKSVCRSRQDERGRRDVSAGLKRLTCARYDNSWQDKAG